ncbi:MAG: T9SS type A sorting domain-containing protein [Leadbetterella sp.]|nr:T9SS type A sorting domain-containing protein [Leadbetterella sp.]
MSVLTSGALFAQSAPESRLNVGKDAKKTLVPNSSNTSIFGKLPEKLNFNSRAEFTQFYRNLLLRGTPESKAEVTHTRASETVTEKIRFGNMYPNPAVNFVEIPYDVVETFKDARVTVMNMVGAPLLESPLSASTGKIKLNTTSLESGIYMVQFVVDGKKVSTKKLLVERN